MKSSGGSVSPDGRVNEVYFRGIVFSAVGKIHVVVTGKDICRFSRRVISMRENLFDSRRLIKAAALAFLICIAAVINVKAVNIYAVTDTNQLIRFDSATPGTTTTIGPITGIQGGENILGIDVRPATGRLYGLGSNSRLYQINTSTGQAIFVATISTALSGANFGFDFNPTVDRIRIVSNTGQNLRVNPNTGAATVDGVINPAARSITAAGYTNSVFGATTTTLYTVDTGDNNLYTQIPPNDGTQVLVGSTGITPTTTNGFDIAPNTNTAYLTGVNVILTTLYTVNLTNGAATSAGTIGGGLTPIRGIAVGSAQTGSPASVTLDFDGDRRTDFSVFRLTTGTWYISRSSNNQFTIVPFGTNGTDTLTPADYDGDGRTDISVWRNTNGVFYVMRSSDNTVQTVAFGSNGDEPISRDFDGDGRADFAVVRRVGNNLVWYINNSINNSVRVEAFGLATDFAASGDYDGDGRFDLAVYRGNGQQPATFFIQRSTLGLTTVQWGIGSDLVVPGDYDGDGRSDFAVVRQGSPYTWYILRSSDGAFSAFEFGSKPQFTAQGDYDGDGRTDIAVWDPATGNYYVQQSSGPLSTTQFGQNGDYPVANFDTH